MEKKRKIAMVVRKVSFAEAEAEELDYNLSLSPCQRLEEVYSLKQMNWRFTKTPYPERMELIGGKKMKSQTDEDDY